MKSLQSAEKAVQNTHVATLAISALLGLAAVGLLVTALLSTTQTAALNVQKQMNQAEIKQIRESLPNKGLRAAKVVNGTQVVVNFQSALQNSATNNACEVEFDAVSDKMPSISKFENGPPAPDWDAIEMQLSITGPLPAILTVLGDAKKFDIPFEFGDLDLQPVRDSETVGNVTARTTMRVLVSNKQGA